MTHWPTYHNIADNSLLNANCRHAFITITNSCLRQQLTFLIMYGCYRKTSVLLTVDYSAYATNCITSCHLYKYATRERKQIHSYLNNEYAHTIDSWKYIHTYIRCKMCANIIIIIKTIGKLIKGLPLPPICSSQPLFRRFYLKLLNQIIVIIAAIIIIQWHVYISQTAYTSM